jgi:vacuolar-type H+-ATPase subunit I/STV1
MSTCLNLESTSAAASGVILPSIQSKGELVDMLVQVRTEGNVKTIGGFLTQLREVLDKVVRAQAKHKKVHKKMMKMCVGEGKFRRQEIKTAKIALAKATKHLQKCRISLKNAQKELPGLVKTLNSYKRELKRAQRQRNIERKKYVKRRNAFREALTFLRHFVTYVKAKLQNYKAAALVEMSENLLKHSNKLNVLTHAAPVLVEIASNRAAHNYKFTPNSKLKAKLMNALKQLITKISTDNAKNEADERRAVAIFTKYKARLDKVINTLQVNVNRVRKQIKEMKRCIAIEGGIIATAGKKIARNLKLLQHAEKMCKSFNKEFIKATYNRLDEIRTMQTILKIVAKRFKNYQRT